MIGVYGEQKVQMEFLTELSQQKGFSFCEMPAFCGNSEDVRDFIYIDDFVDSCIEVMNKVDEYTIYNVGSGKGTTVNEILHHCQTIENHLVTPVYDETKPSMIPIRLLDVSKIKEEIGWEAKTSIKDPIRKTIEWYKEQLC